MKKTKCEHVDRDYYCKGKCRQCYDKNYFNDPIKRERGLEQRRAWHKKMMEDPEYKKEHNRKCSEYIKKRYRDDPEFRLKHLNFTKKYQKEHPEKVKEANYRWRKKNTEKYREVCRRSLKVPKTIVKRLERLSVKCVVCPDCNRLIQNSKRKKITCPYHPGYTFKPTKIVYIKRKELYALKEEYCNELTLHRMRNVKE